jgi:putative oxidoreductase
MTRRLLAGFVQALLVLLFMYTGFNKLFGLKEFTDSLYSQPIPHGLAFFLARLIPVIEIITAVFLLFSATTRTGLYSSFGLLLIFTGYIAAILLHFFRKIPCSCAGIFRHMSWETHLWVNMLFLVLTGTAILLTSPRFKVSKRFHSPLNHSV